MSACLRPPHRKRGRGRGRGKRERGREGEGEGRGREGERERERERGREGEREREDNNSCDSWRRRLYLKFPSVISIKKNKRTKNKICSWEGRLKLDH